MAEEAPKRSTRATKSTEEAEQPSAAELELSVPMAPGGETITRKVNAETPTTQQVEAASGEVPGPPVTAVTVTDADGEEISQELRADDAALISQRAFATASHPAHESPAYSNPSLRELTEEEREADAKEYSSRFG